MVCLILFFPILFYVIFLWFFFSDCWNHDKLDDKGDEIKKPKKKIKNKNQKSENKPRYIHKIL